MRRYLFVLFILLLSCHTATAQRADSLMVSAMENLGVKFSDNNSVTLLVNGQEKFDDLFTAIRQARSSIHLEYFNFRNDSIASLLFDLLAERVAHGVEVRALYDAFGNSSNNRPLKAHHIRALREKGIEIYEFDPIRFPWVNHVFSRDHRKIVVIDGKIAYTGGMNVADYYIKGTPQVGEWHDMHCRIEGDEVNSLQKIFLDTWNHVTHQTVSGSQYYRGLGDVSYIHGLKPDTTSTRGHKKVAIINREPRKSPKIIRQFYMQAIEGAQDSIKLVNPYLTLNRKLLRALYRAVERGVKVEVMISERSDIPLTPDCVNYRAHQLMKHGVKVWVYKPGFHHTKVIMVDGQLCTVGSANLNARSLRWDYEENAIILDREVTQQLSDRFDRDRDQSFLLTPEVWKKWRTPWQRFRGWFAHLLAPFL